MGYGDRHIQNLPIFICYRRSDLSLEAEWLYQFICTFFGENIAYFDRESESGKRWDLSIQHCVTNAAIVLILIGPKWLTEQIPDSGIRRLDDPEDWVHQEVLTAIERYKQFSGERWVFTALVNGASLPKKEWLPKNLADLPSFQVEKKLEFSIKNYLEAASSLYDFFKEKLLLLETRGLMPKTAIERFDLSNVPNPYELREYQLPQDLRFVRPENPFKGLEYFKREDTRIFFGRKKELGELLDLLKKPQSTIRLYGQSGVGKSSFLFAGLLPRLESNGWLISYERRNANKNLGHHLKNILSDLHDKHSRESLIILDQVEEVITNPNPDAPNELEDLASSVQMIEQRNTKRQKPIHLLLSYRKEYDVEVKNALREHSIVTNQYWLRSLGNDGMREAIKGITEDPFLVDEYHIQLETGLENLIINELVDKGAKQDATPLLQFLLRKMWDKVCENDIDSRLFTYELYEECKSKDLQELLTTQLAEVAKKDKALKDAVSAGLPLDVLKCFTSDASTAVPQTEETISNRYSNDTSIHQLLQSLVDGYLLVRQDKKTYRLPHDTLAKAVIVKYFNSQHPGQRAARLLDSKRLDIHDIERGDKSELEVKFSETDLEIIEEGRKGMRKLSDVEKRLIEASHQEVQETKKQLEERARMLEEKNVRLEQSNQSLEEFAYVASHDLKEPLRKIWLFTSRLKEELFDSNNSRVHTYMDRIIRSTERMQRLINDLLSYSRLENTEELPNRIDLNLVLQEALSDIKGQMEENHTIIHADELPIIEANPEHMKTLFQNLLSNAIKFRKENVLPEIMITSRKLEKDGLLENENGQSQLGKSYYELTFSDNGIGFDPKYADQIFNVFQRLHSRTEYEGNGIGLAICKKIIQNHNGNIYATSSIGEGSSFHILLPEKQTHHISSHFPVANLGM